MATDLQDRRRLFFRGYHAGLGNGRLALDIGVMLAHLGGRALCPFGLRPPWRGSPPALRGARPIRSVLDLYEVPVPLDTAHLHEEDPVTPGARPWPFGPVYGGALVHPPDAAERADPRLAAFLHGRDAVHHLGGALADAPALRIDAPTLGVWSSYLYADAATRRALRALLARVRARAPYRALAAEVAASLRPFAAVHLRRGDFVRRRFTPRCAAVSGREVRDNLLTRIGPAERLVVCTDSPEDSLFAPLRGAFREVIFLDRYLLGEPRLRAGLAALPHDCDDALALVSQLVAAEARVFVGTLFSSFTALIQRERGLRAAARAPGLRSDDEFLYAYDDFRGLPPGRAPRYRACAFTPADAAPAPFSWCRLRFPVHPIVHGWFRDWPESFREDEP